MEPINYLGMMQPINLGQNFAQGFGIGANIRAMQQQQEAQKQAQDRAQLYQEKLQAHLANPSYQSASEMIALFPEQREALKDSWDIASKEQKEQEWGLGVQAFNALNSGNIDVAESLVDTQIEALKNSNQDTTFLERMRESLRIDPKSTAGQLSWYLSSVEPEKWNKIQENQRAQELQPYNVTKAIEEAKRAPVETQIKQDEANIKRLESAYAGLKTKTEILKQQTDIDEKIARLNLDKDKFYSDVEAKLLERKDKMNNLEPDARKLVNDFTINSLASEEQSGKLLDLAQRIDNLGGGWGGLSTGARWLQDAIGTESAWNDTRREYTRMRMSEAIKSLPPGPATDKDIALALQGFPKDNADPQTLSTFLRGMAKLKQIEAVGDNAKAEWVNSVGSLARARGDIEILGVQVPKGSSYIDFQRKYIKDKAKELGKTQNMENVKNRSYMDFAK